MFFIFKHPRPQWIQAQKTGAVINFNRWRDWDGKSLRGLDWYKEEEAKEYEGLSFIQKLFNSCVHIGHARDKRLKIEDINH